MAEGKRTVLVVEDDTLLSDLIVRKLAKTFTILYAPTGEAALELLTKERPDLILLDIMLPGIDGFEVLKKIKTNPATAASKVVILSNLGQPAEIAKGKELGAEEYVVKVTLSLDEVVSLCESVVQKAPAPSPAPAPTE